MKKLLTLVLACVLVLSVLPVAQAENSWDLNARSMEFNKVSGQIGYQAERNGYYSLIRADGTVVVGTEKGYIDMSVLSGYPFFEVAVASQDGVHCHGIVDEQGKELVPPIYADVEVVSDRWLLGYLLTPSDADTKDYTFSNWDTGEKAFYRVNQVDFFYNGQKVGSLAREEFARASNGFGAYICVRSMEGKTVFYNSKMEKSPYEAVLSAEYYDNSRRDELKIYHQGSGQLAFVPGCTLTADEVENAFKYVKGQILDLQGNVVATTRGYDYVQDFDGDYARVKMGKYGLMDVQGREVLPLEYDQLGNMEDELLKTGYISAVKDGKFGFLDAQGNVTCEFKYAADAVTNRGTFGTIKDLDGTIIVLTAGAGELKERFQEVTTPDYQTSRAFIGKTQDGQYTVVDMFGKTLVQPSADYRSMNLSVDATVAVATMGGGVYRIFQLGEGEKVEAEAPKAEEPVQDEKKPSLGSSLLAGLKPVATATQQPEPAAEPAEEAAPAPAQDDSWTCDNGHGGNTGKFCSECGQKKPEEKLTACPACNYAFGDTQPKFCPECGEKIAK